MTRSITFFWGGIIINLDLPLLLGRGPTQPWLQVSNFTPFFQGSEPHRKTLSLIQLFREPKKYTKVNVKGRRFKKKNSKKSVYTNVSFYHILQIFIVSDGVFFPRKTNFPTATLAHFPIYSERHLHGQEPVRVFLLSEPGKSEKKPYHC